MNLEPAKISLLLIEDNPGDAFLIQELLLDGYGDLFRIQTFASLEGGLAGLQADVFDVALLDLSLPDSQGMDTILQFQKSAPQIPVIVLTGLEDEAFIHKALEVGAQDYLIKRKIDASSLNRSIRYAIERTRYQQEIGSLARFPDEDPNPVLRVRKDARLVYANTASRPLLAEWGWQVDQPLPADWAERVDIAMAAGERISLDCSCGDRYFAFTIVPFSGLDYANLYAYDITDRINFELQTRESEKRYRTLFENMLDGFAYCRMLYEEDVPIDFIYLEVNRQFEAMTGLVDVIGKPISQLIPGIRQTDPEMFEVNGRVAATGRPEKFETYVHGLDRWLSISVYSPAKDYFIAVFKNITARKQAEEQLMTAHARLKFFVDANIVGVIIANKYGGLVEVNDYYLNLIGYSRAEFEAGLINWKSITPPEHLPADDFAIQELEQRGNSDPYEKEYIRKDGTRVWIYLAIALISDGLMAAFVLDVTARKHAEASLKVSEERFRRYFELGLIGMAITLPDKGMLEFNDHLCDILGYSRDELLQLSWSDLTYPADLPADLAQFQRVLDGEIDGYSLEKRWIRKDGRIIHSIISVKCVRSADGSVDYLMALIQDITERYLAEEQMRLQSAALDAAANSIIILDTQDTVLWANQAFCKIYGYTPLEVIGKSISSLVCSDKHPDDLYTQLVAVPRSGKVWHGEFINRRKDGSLIPIELTAAPVFDRQGSVTRIVQVAQDITARKQYEQDLLQARAELEDRVQQRTADLSRVNADLARTVRYRDEFLANMSHELRSPLNAILGISESLEEQTVGPLIEKQMKYIRTISESGRHLLSLINDILDLSKIDSGKMTLDLQSISGPELIRAALRLVQQIAMQKNIKLTLTTDLLLNTLSVDERRLKQALVNLLTNAIKFTSPGGQVGLDVTADPQNSLVMFSVWDTGIGISAEDLPRLFQPFIQLDAGLDREYPGTGLGLALVDRIARLHDGRVDVSSTPGEGSRFTITLPWIVDPPNSGDKQDTALELTSGQEQSSKPIPVDSAPALHLPSAPRKARILLVEDTEAAILFIYDYLEHHGFEVVAVQDGSSALLEVSRNPPDLILMDIQMPGMSGFEVTRRIRSDSQSAAIPIIALTALAMPGDRERCLQAGMNDYISKPIHLEELIARINRYIPDPPATSPQIPMQLDSA